MRKNLTVTEILLSKLESPIHITYISEYITKLPLDITKDRIDELIEEGLVEESKYGKGYYVRKRNGK
jgi:predicted transcriptional regulator